MADDSGDIESSLKIKITLCVCVQIVYDFKSTESAYSEIFFLSLKQT